MANVLNTDKRIKVGKHQTDDSGNLRHVTVLHIPPAVSLQTAVRAAIIQEYRDNA